MRTNQDVSGRYPGAAQLQGLAGGLAPGDADSPVSPAGHGLRGRWLPWPRREALWPDCRKGCREDIAGGSDGASLLAQVCFLACSFQRPSGLRLACSALLPPQPPGPCPMELLQFLQLITLSHLRAFAGAAPLPGMRFPCGRPASEGRGLSLLSR